jgi:hypothetical protein
LDSFERRLEHPKHRKQHDQCEQQQRAELHHGAQLRPPEAGWTDLGGRSGQVGVLGRGLGDALALDGPAHRACTLFR